MALLNRDNCPAGQLVELGVKVLQIGMRQEQIRGLSG